MTYKWSNRISKSEEIYKALEWLINLHHGCGKNERISPGEWEAAIKAGKKALVNYNKKEKRLPGFETSVITCVDSGPLAEEAFEDCKKCKGTGKVWSYELDSCCTDILADRAVKYPCDWCLKRQTELNREIL